MVASSVSLEIQLKEKYLTDKEKIEVLKDYKELPLLWKSPKKPRKPKQQKRSQVAKKSCERVTPSLQLVAMFFSRHRCVARKIASCNMALVHDGNVDKQKV